MREVRGTNVGRREAALPVEEPGLGVEAGCPRVVGDLHLGAKIGQEVDRAALGRADVGGGEDAQGPVLLEVALEGGFEQAEAVPLDERAQEVDAVGRRDLALEDGAEAGLAASVHEQVAGAEGDGGSRWLGRCHQGLGLDEGCQELGGLFEVVVGDEAGVGLDELVEDLSAEVELLRLGVLAGLRSQGFLQQLTHVAGEESRELDGLRRLCPRLPVLVELADLAFEGEVDQALVEAGREAGVGHRRVGMIVRTWDGHSSGETSGREAGECCCSTICSAPAQP